MFREKDIQLILISEIYNIYGISIIDKNENLLCESIGIFPADFLVLFRVLKEKYGINIYTILENNDSEVFTINGIAKEVATSKEK